MRDLYAYQKRLEIGALDEAEQSVVDVISEAVNYYLAKKARKRLASKFSHFIAILFGVTGGLAPWWSDFLPSIGVELGYPLLAVSAIALLWDKVFDNAAGWQRYVIVLGELSRLKSEFEFRRAFLEHHEGTTDDRWKLVLDTLSSYWDLVLDETSKWSNELPSRVEALDSVRNRLKV